MRLGTIDQMAALGEDLIAFVHRVALDEKASPAEIAALPGVARELCVEKIVVSQRLDDIVADLCKFVHRVAHNKDASPAEIAALPEIVMVLHNSSRV